VATAKTLLAIAAPLPALVAQVPPAINQFTKVLDKNLGACRRRCLFSFVQHCAAADAVPAAAATNLFKLLLKYRPEDKKEKKVRRSWQARHCAAAHDA
jgi:hypothetical protein